MPLLASSLNSLLISDQALSDRESRTFVPNSRLCADLVRYEKRIIFFSSPCPHTFHIIVPMKSERAKRNDMKGVGVHINKKTVKPNKLFKTTLLF